MTTEAEVRLFHGDCRKFMFDGTIVPDSIDLVVTSPPYDNLRAYNNSSTWGWAEFCGVVSGLWHVVKPCGVVVWVVGDATIKGSETGTSFKQALAFKECGFNLHDTMIYQKLNQPPLNHNRYEQCFEYMFIFSKGKPSSVNLITLPCKHAGKINTGTVRNSGSDNLSKKHGSGKPCKKEKPNKNIFEYLVGNVTKEAKIIHPGKFPEKLASDHIKSWSNESDLIFDPFMGSGTTGKMAKVLNRSFIGCEIDPEYFKIAEERINQPVQKGML